VSAELALAAVGVLAGAALQSATGFGFSLIAAPLLFAAFGPVEAVGLMIVLGTETNLLALTTEGRRPRPLWNEVTVLLGWAVPGALVGVAVLRALSATALQIALTVGVVLTLIARRLAPRHTPAWAGPLAGFVTGSLTTSTSTSGPPMLLYLLGRGHEPSRLRDTLVVCFLGLSPIGALALLVTGTSDAVPDLGRLAVLMPATAVGQIAGRPLFARLAQGGRYEPVLTVVLLFAVVIGLVSTFTS
jgi:uncharacterized protein